MNVLLEWLACVLVVLGGLACLLGSLGLVRFPDVFTRLHGPGKVTTLGVGCIVLATVAWFSASEGAPAVQALLILVFVGMTTPVSVHLIARAALHRGLSGRRPPGEER